MEVKRVMSNDQHDFEQFMKQREEAARAYVSGDASPLDEIVAHHASATFFGPRGGHTEGAEAVWATYDRDAANFESGGESHFEVLDMAASDGLAYWMGFQRATTHLHGQPGTVPFNLRVTEIFRREGDSWKLIHRHGDPLIDEPEAK
jgi:ketosteroid isomerase-like protein